METDRESLIEEIKAQPADMTREEILRELIFHQMILKGLEDVEQGRVIAHEEVEKEIESWGK